VTKPSKFFGQRNCGYCSGGPDLVPYRLRSQAGLNYPYIFPGTKLDPEKLSNISITGFTTMNNAAYPGAWHDFVFLYTDNVTKITGNHSFKVGVSVERSGMDDQIQLSFAQAPATTNQNGSFRFNDATRRCSTSPTPSAWSARRSLQRGSVDRRRSLSHVPWKVAKAPKGARSVLNAFTGWSGLR
jgi:hypothetical protein